MQVSSSEILVRNLLVGIKEGDAASFEVFYRMERNNLVHFVFSYIKDYHKSEDIAQDALMRVWEKRDSLDVDGNIRAFVFRIARNMTLDHLRRHVTTESLEACMCLEDRSMESLIEALDMASLFAKTFNTLPPKVRDTFMKSRMQGFTNKEIAEEQKLSVKAIEYRISSALKALRKITKSI